ncbi:M16 family metallopeptidase [Aquirufa antheringensis]|uniref:M16 family metallopeptidase n=1 Tax=Aquirufa antheringensis TaxID=2516559 RepID=UPI0010329F84|nr:pitrilysin family protein [Aquirufa antheringensis]TBH72646.1 insulinase family protein [Aquirufa antheringensis]
MISFEEFTLANGLKVIVHEDPDTTMAVVDVIYNVGSRDEDENLTGFAHLFEHLMFGGSENIPSFDAPLQKVGGENNAFTTPDLTNYYISVPAQNIETAFWLESDRMKQLAFNTQSLETQRKVVIEEFKQRYLNQPYGDVWLKFRPLIYNKHPYRWPTIGAGIQHIEEAQMSDVKAFFQKHYVPSNAVLVVAGKVKLSEVKALAEKWFEPIPAGAKPKRNLPQEPLQTENRAMEIVADVPANRIYKAYPVLGRYELGYHAIDLMADLLGRGESSYLYEHLVQKQRLFDTIGTYQTSSIDPGLLIIQGQVSDNVTIEEAEEALEKAIQDFATSKIAEKDLQMVKNQSEASLVFGEVEVLNRAMNLAMAANAGDANLVNTEAEKIAEVQTQDLEKWAQRLFIQGKSNTLKYKKIAK